MKKKSKKTTPIQKLAAIDAAHDALPAPRPGTSAYETLSALGLLNMLKVPQRIAAEDAERADLMPSEKAADDARKHDRHKAALKAYLDSVARSSGALHSETVTAAREKHGLTVFEIVQHCESLNSANVGNYQTKDVVRKRYEENLANLARRYDKGRGDLDRDEYNERKQSLEQQFDEDMGNALPPRLTVDVFELLVIPDSLPNGEDKLRERAIRDVFGQIVRNVDSDDMTEKEIERAATTFIKFLRNIHATERAWIPSEIEAARGGRKPIDPPIAAAVEIENGQVRGDMTQDETRRYRDAFDAVSLEMQKPNAEKDSSET